MHEERCLVSVHVKNSSNVLPFIPCCSRKTGSGVNKVPLSCLNYLNCYLESPPKTDIIKLKWLMRSAPVRFQL